MRDQSQTVDIVHNYANGLFDEVFCNEISSPGVWWPGPISGGPMNYSGYLAANGYEVFLVEPRFMPLSVKGRLPIKPFLIRAWLASPVKPIGKQMLIRAKPKR